MKKQVLINVEDTDIRVAVLEDGELTQLFLEDLAEKSIVGNVYKARVDSIVPGLKAAFVNIGDERNAFLHFSDIHRGYNLPKAGAARHSPTGKKKKSGGRMPTKSSPEDLEVGDEILVQATKEPLGTKGARVTTYVSLPGRFLVLLPFSDNKGGVSRRIEDAKERKRLRTILRELKVDEGSFIVRTAGLDQEKEAISADVQILKKIWERIRRARTRHNAPALLHDDHDIIGRLVRDELTLDTSELIVDSEEHAKGLRQTLGSMMPSLKRRVHVHDKMAENLFDKYDVETQFQKALKRKVWLKSGGYLIIEEAEALVAIDVNTGKFVGKGDQEDTILQTNLEAAKAVSQQLRLRDVGGIIVIDFIDMKSNQNQRKVLQTFKEYLKRDRARTTVLPLSDYGLMEMTRKRVRESLSKVVFKQCPYCEGMGRVLNEQQIWKRIKYDILDYLRKNKNVETLRVTVHPDVRAYLEQTLLEAAKAIANYGDTALHFVDDPSFHIEHYELERLN